MRPVLWVLALLLSWQSVAAAAQPVDVVAQAAQRAGVPLLWHRAGTLTPAGRAMLQQLLRADERGLVPEDYGAQQLQSLAQSTEAEAQTRLDRLLSQSAVAMAAHLQRGRVSPAAAGYQLPVPAEVADPADTLVTLAGSSDVAAGSATSAGTGS